MARVVLRREGFCNCEANSKQALDNKLYCSITSKSLELYIVILTYDFTLPSSGSRALLPIHQPLIVVLLHFGRGVADAD